MPWNSRWGWLRNKAIESILMAVERRPSSSRVVIHQEKERRPRYTTASRQCSTGDPLFRFFFCLFCISRSYYVAPLKIGFNQNLGECGEGGFIGTHLFTFCIIQFFKKIRKDVASCHHLRNRICFLSLSNSPSFSVPPIDSNVWIKQAFSNIKKNIEKNR